MKTSLKKLQRRKSFSAFCASALLCVLSSGLSSAAFADGYREHAHDYHRERNYVHHRDYNDRYVVSAPVTRRYDYVYYPAQQVYFSPSGNQWYWSNGSAWQSGRYLPSQRYINASIGGVTIQLASALPYYEHSSVSARYPWRENQHYRDARRNEYERHERHERREERERRHEYHSGNWR